LGDVLQCSNESLYECLNLLTRIVAGYAVRIAESVMGQFRVADDSSRIVGRCAQNGVQSLDYRSNDQVWGYNARQR